MGRIVFIDLSLGWAARCSLYPRSPPLLLAARIIHDVLIVGGGVIRSLGARPHGRKHGIPIPFRRVIGFRSYVVKGEVVTSSAYCLMKSDLDFTAGLNVQRSRMKLLPSLRSFVFSPVRVFNK